MPRPLLEAVAAVQPSRAVEQAAASRVAHRVGGTNVRRELHHERFDIEGLTAVLPRAGGERRRAGSVRARDSARHDDRRRVIEERIVAQRPTYLDATHVGHARIEKYRVERRSTGQLERAAASLDANDAVAVQLEYAFERSAGPFAVTRNQNQPRPLR